MHRGILFALAVAACGADLRVDHITVAGNNLVKLQAMFKKAGIETQFGGKHSNGQTQMALASFSDGSYLELIAPQVGADVSSHYWGPFMKANAGPCAWAIRSNDIAGDAARLKGVGVEVRTAKNGRVRPDGVDLKWETADAGPGSPGSFFPFSIHDETPRERRAGSAAGSKIFGVVFVVIAVSDLPAAIAKYRSAFGLSAPVIQPDKFFGGQLAWFQGTPVILAGGNGWAGERVKALGDAPCAFVLGSQEPWKGKAKPLFTYRVHWLSLGGMRVGVSQIRVSERR